jgi:hypothetical protein
LIWQTCGVTPLHDHRAIRGSNNRSLNQKVLIADIIPLT